MTDTAIYYDLSLCTACKGCQIACKQWNQLPSPLDNVDIPFSGSFENPQALDGDTWLRITFNEADGGPNGVAWAFNRDACNHCTEAGCVEACPTGACHYQDDGAVVIDADKCIGCKYCIAACPFGVPKYSERDKVTKKCWLCQDRQGAGREPACVGTCPTEALQFGPRSEMLQMANDRLAKIKERFPDAVVYGDKELGGLHVIRVLPYGAEAHGLPVDPSIPLETKLSSLVKPLTGIGIVGMLGLVTASYIGGRGYKRDADALRYDAKKKDTVANDSASKGGE